MKKDDNIIRKKSIDFAIRIVNCYKYLVENQKEYVMSKQMLRSGTSIGANVNEAIYAESKNDFIHKLSISLKEAAETEYWLLILKETKFIDEIMFNSLNSDVSEIIKILASIIKTSRSNK
ncbi:MAG: four helix bundle protein [Arcicella sp.]|nr:four helix bundle protein [Arcicella sp.]